ncbi:MAG: M48 family metallopeptidase [Thermomonas sp.]
MSELRGLWFDGRSSRGREVSLEREDDSLRLRTGDGREERWPLREVALNPRLGNTPRILRREGHGQVECPDAPELAQWFPVPPSRIEAAADWLERRRLAIAFSAAAVVVLTLAFVRFGVPWMALRIAEHMPAAVERQLSDQVVAVLERTHLHASRLPATRQRALQAGFAALVRGEPRAGQMRLLVVDAPAIGPNAFTLPDGRIYLTDQLVALAKSDDEVMAVLAHEAGHHVHRHAIRQAIESSSVFLAAGLMFGDVSGSSLAASVPAVLLGNGFSRGHEQEADAYAFALLRRRGKSPAAFARILRRLADTHPEGSAEGLAGYLSTHPSTRARIEAAERAGKAGGG